MKPLRVVVPLLLVVPALALAAPETPVTPAPASAPGLIVHEWGTFTSFAGANGVPVQFTPNNADLPSFVYTSASPLDVKGVRMAQGTVSMETPVVYFYADRETRASVRVGFPRGWVTEWFPAATAAPAPAGKPAPGQTVRWDVRVLPGESIPPPADPKDGGHYYRARETDSAAVQSVAAADAGQQPRRRGATVAQREKFLFYRGVGAFPPPVSARALGNGSVRVVNNAGGKVGWVVLVTVRGGKVGFTPLDPVDAGVEAAATLPAADRPPADLGDWMARQLTAAGLYEKEARAMVRTWEAAWFGEDGTRLLYLVPRAKTDELLPLSVDPNPAAIVRVLVGRHDFLTPEREADVLKLVERVKASGPDAAAAKAELRGIGRFADQARWMAEKRLDAAAGRK